MSLAALRAGLGERRGRSRPSPSTSTRSSAAAPAINVAAHDRPHAGAALRHGRGGDRARGDRRRDRARCGPSWPRPSTPARSASPPRSRRPTSATRAGRCRAGPPSSPRSRPSPARSATPGRGVIQATIGRGLRLRRVRRARPGHRPADLVDGAAGRRAGARRRTATLLERVDQAARRRACRSYPQVSCRPLNFEFTMAEPFPFESMKLFGPISAAATSPARRGIYADPEFRAAFAREDGQRTAAASLGGSWDRTVVSWFPPDPSLEGAPWPTLARERGRGPDRPGARPGARGRTSRPASAWRSSTSTRTRCEELLTDPHTMLGLSDAGAHASQLCDSCFSTHLLLALGARAQGARARGGRAQAHVASRRTMFGITDRGPARARAGRPTSSCSTPTRSGAATCAGCTTSPPAPIGWSPTPSASTR